MTASPVTQRPEMKSVVPMIVDRRMFFSTILPKNAAPMPRKKMPSENANCTCLTVTSPPICLTISSEKLVKAYICPTETARRNAGRTALLIFTQLPALFI